MPGSIFNLQKLRAEVLSGAGLARNNRFEVLINAPRALRDRYSDSFLASLYVEQVSLPMLGINARAQRIFGPAYHRPISSEYGGEGIAISFHVDRDMRVKKFFEDWMHAIVDPVTFTVGYQEDYITDIYIRQLNEQDNITHEIKLIEAFPRNMNLMELNNNASNQTHRLNMLFTYRYWKNSQQATLQLTNTPRIITNPQVPSEDFRVPQTQRKWDWGTGDLNSQTGSDLPPSA